MNKVKSDTGKRVTAIVYSSAVHFSSKTDLYATPQSFFDALNDEFGFEVDVCALPSNAKCESYYTPEQDGLKCTTKNS